MYPDTVWTYQIDIWTPKIGVWKFGHPETGVHTSGHLKLGVLTLDRNVPGCPKGVTKQCPDCGKQVSGHPQKGIWMSGCPDSVWRYSKVFRHLETSQ